MVLKCNVIVSYSEWGNFWKDQKESFHSVMKVSTTFFAIKLEALNLLKPSDKLFDYDCVLDKLSTPKDLIVINGIGSEDPTPMYLAHRRGWVTTTETLSNAAYLEAIRGKGCKYVVIVKQIYGDVNLNFPKLHDSEYFKVYDIR